MARLYFANINATQPLCGLDNEIIPLYIVNGYMVLGNCFHAKYDG